MCVCVPAWRRQGQVLCDTGLSAEHHAGLLANGLAGKDRHYRHVDEDDGTQQGLCDIVCFIVSS